MPTTLTGRRGVIVTVAGVVAFIAFVVANDTAEGLGSPWRVLALLLSQLVLLTGGALCVVAIARRGERAPAVIAALVPSALMALAIVAEVTGLIE